MAGQAKFRVEHVAEKPRGWHVRTITRGPHELRIAFPPGRRKKGAGKVVEILHPKTETNPRCEISEKAKKNPGELLIFGNPTRLEKQRAARDRAAKIRGARLNPPGHKKGCKCVVCAHQRKIAESDARMRKAMRDVMTRNPKRKSGSTRSGRRSSGSRRLIRRNPSEESKAVRLFQSFHGRDPDQITREHTSAATRLDYTALGDLEYIKVITPIGQKADFNFEGDGVKLASAPNGKQLYVIGGNQNLLPLLDADSREKDFIDLGEAQEVQYLARKIHGKFHPISYYHKFGEVDGTKPQLMFDKLKRQIFFVGGNYWIDTSQGVSPGIEN